MRNGKKSIAIAFMLLGLGACFMTPCPDLPYETDQFGSRVFAIQDADGDGVEEYAVADDSYGWERHQGPGRVWVLSGRTLECLEVIETPESIGPNALLLGTYAHASGATSPDRIVIGRWDETRPWIDVLDARGKPLGTFALDTQNHDVGLAAADLDADGIRDLVVSVAGGRFESERGGHVLVVHGRSFATLKRIESSEHDMLFGESVAVVVPRGEAPLLLVGESLVSSASSRRGRVATYDTRSWQRLGDLPGVENAEGVSYRIANASAEEIVVLSRRSVRRVPREPTEALSVGTVKHLAADRWSVYIAYCEARGVDSNNSVTALGDRDGDGRSELLLSVQPLESGAPGQLFLAASQGPSLREVSASMPGLGSAIAVARDRTGRVASIAVGASHPSATYGQGQVVLLSPDDLRALRTAHLKNEGSRRVSVDEIAPGDPRCGSGRGITPGS